MKTVAMKTTISTSPKTPSASLCDRPRVEEDDLDVEDDEEHRRQVVLDREAAAGERLVDRLDPALVGVELRAVVPARPDERCGGDREQRERRGQSEQPDDRDVDREHQRHPTVRPITVRAGEVSSRSVSTCFRCVMSSTVRPVRASGHGQTAGARRVSAATTRSTPSPSRPSVRLPISRSAALTRAGRLSPWAVANRTTSGRASSARKPMPSRWCRPYSARSRSG